MISLVRNRLGIPGLLAIIALVFAMGGAAYAGKRYVITSTKQIKPKVLKQLKGKRGPQGPQGSQGPQGPAGANGANGKAGANGTNGTDGASVVTTALGIEEGGCEQGGLSVEVEGSGTAESVCNGSPWTVGGLLPSGKTETGTYGTTGHNRVTYSEGGSGELIATTASTLEVIPISFALPLELPPEEAIFVEGASATGCPGIENGIPTAEAGKLCVYKKTGPGAPAFSSGTTYPNPGPDSNGAVMFFTCASANCTWAGTWAVTAP